MIQLASIGRTALATDPFGWAFVGDLFAPRDAADLAATYPCDQFKAVKGYDPEKGFEYESRSLVGMGADAPSHPDGLSRAWKQLAADLVSPGYRAAMSRLTGMDLQAHAIEVNVFHYGPGAWLGPHLDLKDKLVTHVLYFNDSWNVADGGCLTILRSKRMDDVAAVVPPVVGNSAVLVRSLASWHAVSRVADGCRKSRRSVTVTFYHPGAVSTMWPPHEQPVLHRYDGGDDAPARAAA